LYLENKKKKKFDNLRKTKKKRDKSYKKMKLLAYIFIIACFVCTSFATKGCVFDAQCPKSATCEHDLINPIGFCKEGLPKGNYCLKDKSCASKNCHLFKCV